MPPLEVVNDNPGIYLPNLDLFPFLEKIFSSFAASFPTLFNIFKHSLGFLVGISIPISFLLIIGIVYCVERLKTLRKKEEEIYDLKVESAYEAIEGITGIGTEDIPVKNDPALEERWNTIGKHINSDNPNDWKQAIIDADTILDDVLTKLGYQGDSVGEKLKRAEPADFATVKEAWEAHRARNEIAHSGSSFNLNHHEAKRIFQLYKKVFEEFYYI